MNLKGALEVYLKIVDLYFGQYDGWYHPEDKDKEL